MLKNSNTSAESSLCIAQARNFELVVSEAFRPERRGSGPAADGAGREVPHEEVRGVALEGEVLEPEGQRHAREGRELVVRRDHDEARVGEDHVVRDPTRYPLGRACTVCQEDWGIVFRRVRYGCVGSIRGDYEV